VILYLGTSCLIKLYVDEEGSEEIRTWLGAAEIVATCRIAYTEVMSALETRLQTGDISRENYDRVVAIFSEDWSNVAKVDFDECEAGDFVKKYGLSRFGALHLSAAKLLAGAGRQPESAMGKKSGAPLHITLLFSSVDERLLKAAKAEGLNILPLQGPARVPRSPSNSAVDTLSAMVARPAVKGHKGTRASHP
jgi:uncharacterized protein